MTVRKAGELLGGFHEELLRAGLGKAKEIGAGVGKAVAGMPALQTLGAGTPEEIASYVGKAPVVGGLLKRVPAYAYQTAAQNLPYAAQYLATGGTLMAGASALGQMSPAVLGGTPNANQLGYKVPVTSFANQPYMGGGSPLTNAAASQAALEEMKFQHRLELVQARQAASVQRPNPDVGVIDPQSVASAMFRTVEYK